MRFAATAAATLIALHAPALASADPLLQDPSPIRLALVYQDKSLVFLGRDQLPGEDLRGFHHAWVWSLGAPPQQISAEAFRATSTSSVSTAAVIPDAIPEATLNAVVDDALEAAHARQSQGRLKVRLVPPPEGFPPGLSVFAGPAEMWTEIPEPQMPVWPVPEDGGLTLPRDPDRPWRLRLVGPDCGTHWIDVPPGRASVELFPQTAPAARLRVVGENGEPLPSTYVKVLEGSFGRNRSHPLAFFVTDAEGVLEIPALADGEALALTFFEPRHAPRAWTGQPVELPVEIRLAGGATVAGRFLDPRGRPLAGVRVRLDGWLADDVATLFLEVVKSGEDGRWEIPRAPRRTLTLTARAPGHADWRGNVDVDSERMDLGDLVLSPGIEVLVRVVEDTGVAVMGARLEAGAGRSALSDRAGLARLQGLAAGERVSIKATAPGHLPAELRLTPPVATETRLTLGRALTVKGRFTDPDGRELAEAQIRVETGNHFRNEELTGGEFEIDLPPEVASRLELSSPETSALAVPVPPGAPGEVRDLGELRAPPGLVAAGVVISEVDGAPVAGARVWALRPSPAGPLVAWVQGEVLRATSDAEGRFEVRGLPAAPGLLRIDAPGFARAYRELRPVPEEGRLELGEVGLTAGATLEVVAGEDAGEGAQVRVDPRGDGLEPDLLTARLQDGRAEVPHVPAGRATLQVIAGLRVLCDKEVEVPRSAARIEVECRARRTEVEGRVLVGGEPAGLGTLAWSSASSAPPVAGLVYNRLSPGGLRQQQAYGVSGSRVSVAVDDRGAFSSADLRPGAWRVSWMPDGRTSGGAPREVEIPEVDRFTVVLEFPGGAIRGVVVDDAGDPVAQATVQEPGGRAVALSGPDGRFELSGLAAGLHRVQARWKDRRSETVPVEIVERRPPDPLRLVLREARDGRVVLTLTDRSGQPAPGGFVFLEAEGQTTRMLSTDLRGEASVGFSPPYPPRLHLAAFHGGQWFLGSWMSWDRAHAGLAVAMGETGGLLLTSEELDGSASIEGPGGWDLSRLLARLGSRPVLTPERPLQLGGLPPGGYTVRLGSTSAQIRVEEDEVRELELRGDAASAFLPPP